MAQQKYAPGSWIAVPIATGTTSATMVIGDVAPQPAFIENVKARRDVATYAKRRCPDLRPGQYRVRVFTDAGVTETTIQVV
jgi:hypothetical protein